jgi:cytoskeletal protein RodZ
MPPHQLEDRPLNGEDHFGAYLAQARLRQGQTIADVSVKTKVPEHQLHRLEAAEMDALPAEVFVRGFVRAHARAVGACPEEAMRRLAAFLAERQQATRRGEGRHEPSIEASDEGRGRRRFGVALVLLILMVATLAASILLRRPTPSTVGGISLAPVSESIAHLDAESA